MPGQRDYRRKAGVLLGYVLLASLCEGLSYWLTTTPGAALWDPAAGLHLALVVLVGPAWAVPGILTVALAGALLISDAPLPLARLIGPALAVAAGHGIVGAWMRRMAGPRPMTRLPVIARLALACLLLPGAVAALAVLSYTLTGAPSPSWAAFADAVASWWLAGAVGVLTLMPILLVALWGVAFPHSEYLVPRRLLGIGLRGGERLEYFGQLAAVAAALYAAFFLFPESGPLYYVCLLPVLWMALRRRSRVTLGIFLTNVGAVLALSRQGPPENVQGFQLFAIVLCLTSLLVGARETERQHALRHLEAARDKLRRHIDAFLNALPAPAVENPNTVTTLSPAEDRSETSDDVEALQRYINQIEHGQDRLAAVNDQLAASEQRLRLANARKDEFLANLSHEFRTPLTLILGPLAQLKADDALPQAQRDQLGLIHRNALRLKRLVEQILDLARLDSARLPTKAFRRDAAAFAQDMALAFTPLAERKEISLSVDVPNRPLLLYFDADHLEKILSNLLSNALKFTPPEGRVTVSVAEHGDHARIAVEDTGIGLSEKERSHIFDRFYQADPSATRKNEGMGIGLALSRELVEIYGGSIHVESEPGAGSRFIVEWPTGREHLSDDQVNEAAPDNIKRRTAPHELPNLEREATPSGEVDPTAGPNEPDRPTVLVVDDNADLRWFVREQLVPDYRVAEAADGEEGLKQARAVLPDCIVADVMMPRLDGFAMSRRLKDDAMTVGIPLLFLTARTSTADEVEGLLTGADGYLRKPFEAEVLSARVEGLIARQQRLRERLERERDEPASAEHRSFEQRVRATVRERLHDPDFGVNELAASASLGPRQLTRRLKDGLDLTPARLIHRERMEQAARLLGGQEDNVTQVAYAVGFRSLSHFSQTFKAHFGTSPSQYA